MNRLATSLFSLVVLLFLVCSTVSAQSVSLEDGFGVLEPLHGDADSFRAEFRAPATSLSLRPLPFDPGSSVRLGNAVGEDSGRSFWTRVLVSGAVGGLAGYVLGGWIDGMGDCVWPDESRCASANADQQGFVVGTSVGVLVSGILYFW